MQLTKFEDYQKENSPLIAKANSIIIRSEKDVENASTFLSQINGQIKKIEAARVDLTAPLNQTLSKINAAAKKAKEALEQSKIIISNNILAWRREVQRQIDAEEERRRKIQEAHKKQGHQVKEPVVLEKPSKTVGASQAVKVWKWEVVDKTQVPDDYKMIDDVRVNQVIRNMQKDGVKEMSIKGLRIYQDEILRVKSNW